MDVTFPGFALFMMPAARVADDSRVAFGGITGLFFGIGGGAPRPLLLFTGFALAWRLLFFGVKSNKKKQH